MNLKNILGMFVILAATVSAQVTDFNSVHLSLFTGFFITDTEGFKDIYESKSGLVYGFGAAVPVKDNFGVMVKATNFSKSTEPGTTSRRYDNSGQLIEITEGEGEAEFTQWIFNAGAYYRVYTNYGVSVSVNGGFSYSVINEEITDFEGKNIRDVNNAGSTGLFIGGNIERRLIGSRFNIYFEPQYIFEINNTQHDVNTYRGINLNFGFSFLL